MHQETYDGLKQECLRYEHAALDDLTKRLDDVASAITEKGT